MNANPSGAKTMLGETEYADRLALLAKARAGDQAAIRTLQEKYRVRIGMCHVQRNVTSGDTVHQEATMGEMVRCEVCGKAVARRGLGVHKARAHGKASQSPPKVQPPAATAAGNGCASCLFRGLDRHLDQELVAEAVRGGMGLAAAAAFVRRVRETA